MGAIDTKSFKSGNSVAVRFPRALGLAPDVPLRIEREGDSYRVTPQGDPEEGKRRLQRLVDRLRAIGPADEPQQREPIEFPDRPGLYD